jgi:hypothetical protein
MTHAPNDECAGFAGDVDDVASFPFSHTRKHGCAQQGGCPIGLRETDLAFVLAFAALSCERSNFRVAFAEHALISFFFACSQIFS